MFDYERALQQAMIDDEKGRWQAACKGYINAGKLLIKEAPFVSEADLYPLIESAKRLLDCAEMMKKRYEQEKAAKEALKAAGSSGRNSSSTGNSDDDDISFTPEAERPNIRFEDIAGLEEAKRVIREEIINPYLHPEIYQRFGQDANGGILLYGPPGTGKTMMAKAIAAETDAAFFSIRCSDIVGKYFGEAERRLKGLFNSARETGNAIIFFDEFEALACKRGGNSTVMNRVVPELLSQMDGFKNYDGRLVVIAATNRPQSLDHAFLRYPRLSHHIYVPLPDYAARLYLFKHEFKKIPVQGNLNLEHAAQMTEGFNCADIKNIVNQATRGPINRGLKSNNNDQFVTAADLEAALRSAKSSVQPSDIEDLEKWRKGKY